MENPATELDYNRLFISITVNGRNIEEQIDLFQERHGKISIMEMPEKLLHWQTGLDIHRFVREPRQQAIKYCREIMANDKKTKANTLKIQELELKLKPIELLKNYWWILGLIYSIGVATSIVFRICHIWPV